MTALEELKRKLDQLSPTGVRFVARMVEALSAPPKVMLEAHDSWLTDGWIEYFGLALSVHHGTTTEPLAQKGFETVFSNACEASGWEVGDPVSETHRFLDLEIQRPGSPRQKLSLKSTAAQRLSRTSAHISKLTEAAWIQDMRTARERRDRTLSLFRAYVDAVDSIIMLRAFREGKTIPSRYQLIEIPTGIFESLETTPLSAFNADGPTINCSYRGHDVAACVSLDRSDAKITIKKISLAACTVHVEWEMTAK
ncbi:MAG: hypothetical protein F4093_03285 [Gammaproteobacteria bacterium]|nr:hypothetical protein [Gammaproteobacteria bacterium]MYJ51686.1 hypothetical protein [Gammaproteobacteria bacterium]